MENIATCAPWLSSLSLITAKMRPPGISPALKLHFEKEKVVMKSSGHRVSHWISPLVKHALQLTLGGHQGSQPAVQHCFSMKIDFFFFFNYFSHLQGCLLQLLVWFPYFKELILNCSHDTSPDPCPPLLMCNTYSNHCTTPEDDCEQPWPLPDSLGNHVGVTHGCSICPRFARPAPHKPILQLNT